MKSGLARILSIHRGRRCEVGFATVQGAGGAVATGPCLIRDLAHDRRPKWAGSHTDAHFVDGQYSR